MCDHQSSEKMNAHGEDPISPMRRFYNMFPYPNRFFFVRPLREGSLTTHGGFFRLIESRETSLARKIWERQRLIPQTPPEGMIKKLDEGFTENEKILLVGCGTDEPLLFRILHPNNKIVALDLSERSLRRASLRTALFGHEKNNKTAFYTGDFSTIPISEIDAPFNYIQCFGVLHHQKNPKDFLFKLVEALAPCGILRVMIYSYSGRKLERKIQSLQAGLWRPNSSGWTIRRRQLLFWVRQVFSLLLKTDKNWGERFRYLGTSTASVADALLHPSDPGLKPSELVRWAEEAGLSLLFCEAKIHPIGWRAGIENAEQTLDEILLAEKESNIVSNLTFVFKKS
jgi:SAM-dependent methyltransferase